MSELLIAASIVTVVLLGLGVAILALKKMDAGFAGDAFLSLKLQGMAEDIRYSARQAKGIKNDPGILLNAEEYIMCFRTHWVPYADSPEALWRCYSLLPFSFPSGSFKTRLYSCDLPEPGGCTSESGRYLGDLVKDVFSTSGPDTYCNRPTFSVSGPDYSFRFKLIARKDPSSGASPGCSQPLDRGTDGNPQEVIEYSIYPEAHSF